MLVSLILVMVTTLSEETFKVLGNCQAHFGNQGQLITVKLPMKRGSGTQNKIQRDGRQILVRVTVQ